MKVEMEKGGGGTKVMVGVGTRRGLGVVGLVGWHRAGLAVVAVIVILLLRGWFSEGNYALNFRWPTEGETSWTRMLKTWDGQHYLYLAEQGYRAGEESARFYPLWPIVIRAGAWVTGGNYLVSALLLANVFSAGAMLLFYRLVRLRHGEAAARAACVMLLAYPGAFFLVLPYSEALFLLLVTATWNFLAERRWWLAGVAGFFLPIARPVGVLVLGAVVWEAWRGWKEDRRWRWGQLACVALPVLGVGVYFGFMQLATGNAWEAFEAQRWLKVEGSLTKVADVWGFVKVLLMVDRPGAVTIFDRAAFLEYCVSLVLMWRMRKGFLWYAVPMGLIPAMTLSLVGFLRHAMMVFPMFVVLGVLVSKPGREKWIGRLARWGLTLQVVLMALEMCNYWVA